MSFYSLTLSNVFNLDSFSAEFIIALAKKNKTFDKFKTVLIKNGAEFADSFIENLLRIIEHMDSGSKQSQKSQDVLAVKFPGLAMPNDAAFDAKPDNKILDLKGGNVVDEAMSALEALAPSQNKDVPKNGVEKENKAKPEKRQRSVEKSRKRSRSRDHSKRYKRSRSRDRRSRRSRSRSTGRNRRKQRSRSRDRRRDRSRDRSRDRRTRNRSVERRKRSPTPDLPVDPEAQKVYTGKVANIVPFGCFVQLEGLKKRWEGLVHISQLRREGRVTEVAEVVSRGQKVWVRQFISVSDFFLK